VLSSSNKSKSKSKLIVNTNANELNSKVAMPVPNTMQNNIMVVTKLAASAAIVKVVHLHLNGTAILHAKDCNNFVREVLTLIHMHLFSHFFTSTSFCLHLSFLLVVVLIDGYLICGLTLNIVC